MSKKKKSVYKRISSTRALTPDGKVVATNKNVKYLGVGSGNGDNKEPLFKESTDLEVAMYKYVDKAIEDNEPPTLLGLSRMVGCSYNTLFTTFNRFPELHTMWKSLVADILSTGAMKGNFRDAPTIFALKNQCGWTDKRENVNKNESGEIIDKEKTEELVKTYLNNLPSAEVE